MSSSDPWINSLTAATTGAATSPASSAGFTIVSGGSGISGGGTVISGEYGGGAKRANLFFFDPAAVRLCLGTVGAGGRRFCTKPRLENGLTCGVLKHTTKFDPQGYYYYLRSNDAMAFCEPCLSRDLVPVEFQENIASAQKTIDEWKQLFTDYSLMAGSGGNPEDAGPTQYVFPDPGLLSLKTPKKVQQQLSERVLVIPIELDDIVNQDEAEALTRAERWWDEPEDESLLPPSLLEFLRNVRGFLLRYDQWLREPIELLARRLDTASDDLHRLKQHCDGLQKSLGRPLSLMGSDFPDVWSALEFLSADPRSVDDAGTFRQTFQDLQRSVNSLLEAQAEQVGSKERVASLETLMATHAARFDALHPILTRLTETGNKFLEWEAHCSRSTAPDPWLSRIGAQQTCALPIVSPSSSPSHGAQTSSDNEARLKTLERLVNSLEKTHCWRWGPN